MGHPKHPQTIVNHMHNQAFQKEHQCWKQGAGTGYEEEDREVNLAIRGEMAISRSS